MSDDGHAILEKYLSLEVRLGCKKGGGGGRWGGGGGGGGDRSELLSLVEYYDHRSFHIHMISRIAVLDQNEVVGYGYCWGHTLAAPALWQGRPWPHHSFIL